MNIWTLDMLESYALVNAARQSARLGTCLTMVLSIRQYLVNDEWYLIVPPFTTVTD